MKKLLTVLLVALGVMCARVNADTYQFPIVTSVHPHSAGIGGAAVLTTVTMSSVTLSTPSTWDLDTPLADVMVREGYSRSDKYYASVVLETSLGCSKGCIWNANLSNPYSGTTPFKKVLDEINERFSGSFDAYYAKSTGRCYGFLIWSRTDNNVPTEQFLQTAWNGGVNGEKCVSAPPVNQWCAFTSGRTDVDFGTLTVSAAAAVEKTVSAKVYCTSNMSYSISAPQGPSVMLSNGMSALIKIGGMKPGSYLYGREGENAVDISATLMGTPTRSGSFAGNTLLFVTYP